MSRVGKFYKDMEPNFECAAAIFKAIDANLYKEYADRYEHTICRLAGLRNVQSPSSVWCSMVLITNLNVNPHGDHTDRKDGWVLVQCFGNFDEEGGQTVCSGLGLIFNMCPGDIILMRSAILEHYVRPWLTGKRVSCVYWTHAGMFEYGLPKKNRPKRKQRAKDNSTTSVPTSAAPTAPTAPAPASNIPTPPTSQGDKLKFDWAMWREKQDQKEAHEEAGGQTTLPQPGVGEGVGSGYCAGGANWGQEVVVLKDSDDDDNEHGKAKAKGDKAEGKAKLRGTGQGQGQRRTATKRQYQEVDTSSGDGEEAGKDGIEQAGKDEDALYQMATVEDPYRLAMDLQRVL